MNVPALATPSPAARIAVVVLTRNRVRQAIAAVARLSALPEAPPVVVADNASTDASVGLLGSLYPSVRIVQELRDLGTAGFNRAIAVAGTDYVACCDDSTWWAAGALAHAVRAMDADPRIAVLAARITDASARTLHPACAFPAGGGMVQPGIGENTGIPNNDDGLPGPLVGGYLAGACVVRRAAFRAFGGYDPRFARGGAEQLLAFDLLAAGQLIVRCDAVHAYREPLVPMASRSARCMLARNLACIAWRRLPAGDALRATARALAEFARQHALGPMGVAFVGHALHAVTKRRVVPPAVARLYRQTDRGMRRNTGSPVLPERHDRSGQRA